MRDLNLIDIKQVSGGDFDMAITGRVEAGVENAFTYVFSQILNRQIVDITTFMTAMEAAIQNGANFNEVRLESINFNHFN